MLSKIVNSLIIKVGVIDGIRKVGLKNSLRKKIKYMNFQMKNKMNMKTQQEAN